MLTKSDISQIRGVVREEVEIVVESVVEKKLQPIQKDLNNLKQDLSHVQQGLNNVSQDLSHLKKDMKNVKKDLKYVKTTVDLVVKNYDEGDVRLERRLTKIEHHLSL